MFRCLNISATYQKPFSANNYCYITLQENTISRPEASKGKVQGITLNTHNLMYHDAYTTAWNTQLNWSSDSVSGSWFIALLTGRSGFLVVVRASPNSTRSWRGKFGWKYSYARPNKKLFENWYNIARCIT